MLRYKISKYDRIFAFYSIFKQINFDFQLSNEIFINLKLISHIFLKRNRSLVHLAEMHFLYQKKKRSILFPRSLKKFLCKEMRSLIIIPRATIINYKSCSWWNCINDIFNWPIDVLHHKKKKPVSKMLLLRQKAIINILTY